MALDRWTVGRLIEWATPYLAKSESPSARLDAEVLLSFVMKCQRIDLYLNWNKPLTANELQHLKVLLKRRSGGEPVAYITGVREFFGHPFTVNPAVLIPRPDSEIIIERLIAEYSDDSPNLRILDIGTGSGCLAVSASLRFQDAQVEAWDIHEGSLDVARNNAASLGASCDFRQVDALKVESWHKGQLFDFIISNPPYVTATEYANLEPSVKNFEPQLALLGQDDGLVFYQTFAEYGGQVLRDGGKFIVEIGSAQGAPVVALFESFGWTDVKLYQDYAKLDRVVVATKPTGILK